MEIVLATHHLGLGGSESYLVTVAEQLQRLGHRVRLRAAQLGAGTAPARERGLRVEGPEADLPKCDAVIVQDAAMTYACARALPSVPRVFVAHSELFDAQLPPQQPGLVNVVVVLNARAERRVRALGRVPEVVRLRQPIDTERFAAREVIRTRPARALVLSNYVHGQRLELLRDA